MAVSFLNSDFAPDYRDQLVASQPKVAIWADLFFGSINLKPVSLNSAPCLNESLKKKTVSPGLYEYWVSNTMQADLDELGDPRLAEFTEIDALRRFLTMWLGRDLCVFGALVEHISREGNKPVSIVCRPTTPMPVRLQIAKG